MSDPRNEDEPLCVVYRVDDPVLAAVARAVELGATVEHEPHDTPYGRLAALADPTGTRFKLVQG